MARRHFRQSGDERGAPAGDAHLRAHASAVAALSSRAQDRRADARPRARPQRHRNHRAHGAAAARADHRRARPDRRRAAGPFRLALRRRHRRHGRALYVVHLCRDRVAHRHPPQDERRATTTPTPRRSIRCSTTRPSNISPPRRARPARYDRSMARYEDASVKAYVSLAVLNAGQAVDLHRRACRHHGAVRLRHRARHQHGRRFRHDQRHDDPALSAAEFHGHGVSRDQAGGDRHREHVLAACRASRRSRTGRARSRCRCAPAPSASRMSRSPTSRRGRSSKA